MKMKKFLPPALFILGILSACNQDKQDVDADISAIKGIYETYQFCINTGNLDSLMTLFTEDAKRISPGIPTIVGKENIRAAFREILGVADHKLIPYGDHEVVVRSDFAFTTYSVTIESTPKDGGSAVQMDIKGLTIFKKMKDGSWKTYIDCMNLHPTLDSDSISSDILEEKSPYY